MASDDDEPLYCTHCGTNWDDPCGDRCVAHTYYTSGAHEALGDLAEDGPFCHFCGAAACAVPGCCVECEHAFPKKGNDGSDPL